MTNLAPSELIKKIEARRRAVPLTQTKIAQELGLTQGHYSKIVRGLVPAGPTAIERIKVWLGRSAKKRDRRHDVEQLIGELVMTSSEVHRGINELAKLLR